MTPVETMNKWDIISELLIKHGYRRWQWQYAVDEPEGLHVWFWASRRPDVEVVTHSEDVFRAILHYNNPEK